VTQPPPHRIDPDPEHGFLAEIGCVLILVAVVLVVLVVAF
jgi:hypothetical protein